MRTIALTEKQFEALETGTRRALMEQLMIIDTPLNRYALGTSGGDWTIVKYEVNESIGGRQWPKEYKPAVIDRWHEGKRF